MLTGSDPMLPDIPAVIRFLFVLWGRLLQSGDPDV
jgi:hypothetical protein